MLYHRFYPENYAIVLVLREKLTQIFEHLLDLAYTLC